MLVQLCDVLSGPALESIDRVRRQRFSYGVRLLRCPQGRLLVVLGEAHLKTQAAWATGCAAVNAFSLRGVETAHFSPPILRLLMRATINGPRWALRALTLGWLHGSTITYARQCSAGRTTLLEHAESTPLPLACGYLYLVSFFGLTLAAFSGASFRWDVSWLTAAVTTIEAHLLLTLVPAWLMRETKYGWLVNPLTTVIVVRDAIMARSTATLLASGATPGPNDPVLLIMGRGHLPGFTRQLVERHGFEPLELL